MSMKNPDELIGSRLVAQCLSQLRHRVPSKISRDIEILLLQFFEEHNMAIVWYFPAPSALQRYIVQQRSEFRSCNCRLQQPHDFVAHRQWAYCHRKLMMMFGMQIPPCRWQMAGWATTSALFPRGACGRPATALCWCGENRVKGKVFLFLLFLTNVFKPATPTIYRDNCNKYLRLVHLHSNDVYLKTTTPT